MSLKVLKIVIESYWKTEHQNYDKTDLVLATLYILYVSYNLLFSYIE